MNPRGFVLELQLRRKNHLPLLSAYSLVPAQGIGLRKRAAAHGFANAVIAAPGSAGWSMEKLVAAQEYAATLEPTAVIIVQDVKVIASWGDVSRKVNIASVRKSLLSALYGIAVSEGQINLASTLADLGIDDKPPALTAAEKQATARDLLLVTKF